jgi:hypothetical protein
VETTARDHPTAHAGCRRATPPDKARFWDQSRTAVLVARVPADPIGCRAALRERRIVAWRNQTVARRALAASGWPARGVPAVAADFDLLSESDPEAASFYRRRDPLGAGVEPP